MVDVSGSEEFLELVKSSLLAALEALSPAALFGLVTFGSKVGLYDLQGPVAAVKSVAIPSSPSLCSHPAYIPLHPSPPPTRWGPVAAVKSVAIPSSSAHRLPLALGDLLPLPAFLASLSRHKEDAAAALKTPRPPPALSPGRPPTSALTLYPSPPLPTPPLPHRSMQLPPSKPSPPRFGRVRFPSPVLTPFEVFSTPPHHTSPPTSDLLPLHSTPTPLYSPQPYQVGLYDLQGPVAAVKSVAIPASSSHRLPLALGDLLPLPAFLASLSRHKEHAAAALETLRPDPPPLDLDASGAGKSGGGKGGPAQGAGGKGGGGKGGKDAERGRRDGVRGFGTALDALIRYLGGMEDGPSARIARGLRADVINTSGSGGGGGGGNVSIAAAAAAAAAAGEVGPFVGARLLVFLSGAPNHGMGALSTVRYDTALASLAVAASQRSRSAKDVADPVVADKGLLQEQTPFYRELAAAAVQAGVCVDLFTVPSYASNGDENASREDGGAATADPASAAAAGVAAVTIADPPPSTPSSLPIPYCDLASLRCLSVESGGTLFLYPSLDEATLPQDIYRMLCRPSAFGGVLRLRTSRELRAVRAYGHFFPDAQYENLYHIIRCDPFDSYAFDLEFAGKAGFGVKGRAGKEKGGSGGGNRGAVLQLAFQYTVIIPVEGGGERGEGGGVGNGAANNGDGAATGVNGTASYPRISRGRSKGRQAPPTGLVIRASLEEGVREGRLLLQDWLVILTAHHNHAFGLAQFNQPHSVTRLDVIKASLEEGVREGRLLLQDWLVILTAHHNHAFGLAQFNQPFPSPPSSFPQVIRASLEEGVREGRLLLQDWLIILTAHYNHAFGLAQFNQPHSVTRLDNSPAVVAKVFETSPPLPTALPTPPHRTSHPSPPHFPPLPTALPTPPHRTSHPSPPLFPPLPTAIPTRPHRYSHPSPPLFPPLPTAIPTPPHRYSHPSPPLFPPLPTAIPTPPHRYSHPSPPLFPPLPTAIPTPPHRYSHPSPPLFPPLPTAIPTPPHRYSHPSPPLFPPLPTAIPTPPHRYSHPSPPLFPPLPTAIPTPPHRYSHPSPPLFPPLPTAIPTPPHRYSHPSPPLFPTLPTAIPTPPHRYSHPSPPHFLGPFLPHADSLTILPLCCHSHPSPPQFLGTFLPHADSLTSPLLLHHSAPHSLTNLYLVLSISTALHPSVAIPTPFVAIPAPPHRSSLDPPFLMRAVYPVLSSYTTPDRPAFPHHSHPPLFHRSVPHSQPSLPFSTPLFPPPPQFPGSFLPHASDLPRPLLLHHSRLPLFHHSGLTLLHHSVSHSFPTSSLSTPSVAIPTPPHRSSLDPSFLMRTVYPFSRSFLPHASSLPRALLLHHSRPPRLPPLPITAFFTTLLTSFSPSLPLSNPCVSILTTPHRSSLDPSFLMRAVYPVLSSYTTPDRPAFPRHSLSRAALVTSGSPIFLLDAFSTIIVFYSPAAPPDLPFPPPQTSLLRTTINRLKADRIITPRTITIRGGVDSTAPFETFLIEEQDVDGDVEGGAVSMGFVAFLESIARDVREYMK
ncbi:unnamed protein product [Closterium sp. Naga37s-1]|nr:unnamed protein product [Closterium sp. Naga37s-1]